MSSTITCLQNNINKESSILNKNHEGKQMENMRKSNKWRRRLILKLKPKPNITWDKNTIDNEFLGKKKSKCCCTHPNLLKKKYGQDWEKHICQH